MREILPGAYELNSGLDAAGVVSDGLSEPELTALASQGAIIKRESKMTDSMKDMLRSVLMAFGAVLVYMGVMDEAMVNEMVGSALVLFSVVWSWAAPRE